MITRISDLENISTSKYYKLLFAELHSKSKEPKLIMHWSLRSINGSPKELMQFKFCLIGMTLGFLAFIAYLFRRDDEWEFVAAIAAMLACICWALIAGREVKTTYRYKIFSTHARLAYCVGISRHVSTFIKGFAIFGIACIFLIGLISGSTLILAGPCGMAIFAALRLLNMKIPKKRKWSAPWDEYNYVTVDRKRRFIVTHVSDQTFGFEARLPNDELFEQYLAFLRTVLPASAQFTEKKWNLSLI